MTVPTTRLGLTKWLSTDAFSETELAQNWDKVDAVPGLVLCQSTSRPTGWGSAHAGMCISETDTGVLWRWNGSAFVRLAPVGHLGTNRRTASLTSTGTTWQMLCQVDAVVPPGGRAVELAAAWNTVTTAPAELVLRRAATDIARWVADINQGGSYVYTDTAAPAGAVSYSFQFRRLAATNSTLVASAAGPASLSVKEI